MNLADLSILLIEPSSTQQKIILTHLKDEGLTMIDVVKTGKEALDFIMYYPPDLIISSMYLPDMTATDLLATIRDMDTLKEINFLLISSETNNTALESTRQAGVVAVLTKPFVHDDLRRALLTTIDYIDPEQLELENYDVTELKVLLVDDSSTARKHIRRVLTNLGIQNISVANSGLEAMTILAKHELDLIVTALNMPEMDGHQLTEYVRNEMGNTYVPILMVTSEHDPARLAQLEQAGVSATCDQHFEPNLVHEILHRVLDQ
jgi:two-component system chemotaxis response regulator CheY